MVVLRSCDRAHSQSPRIPESKNRLGPYSRTAPDSTHSRRARRRRRRTPSTGGTASSRGGASGCSASPSRPPQRSTRQVVRVPAAAPRSLRCGSTEGCCQFRTCRICPCCVGRTHGTGARENQRATRCSRISPLAPQRLSHATAPRRCSLALPHTTVDKLNAQRLCIIHTSNIRSTSTGASTG
jgi:hypothetical protein